MGTVHILVTEGDVSREYFVDERAAFAVESTLREHFEPNLIGDLDVIGRKVGHVSPSALIGQYIELDEKASRSFISAKNPVKVASARPITFAWGATIFMRLIDAEGREYNAVASDVAGCTIVKKES